MLKALFVERTESDAAMYADRREDDRPNDEHPHVILLRVTIIFMGGPEKDRKGLFLTGPQQKDQSIQASRQTGDQALLESAGTRTT